MYHVLLPIAVNSKPERKGDSLELLGFEPAISTLATSLTAGLIPTLYVVVFFLTHSRLYETLKNSFLQALSMTASETTPFLKETNGMVDVVNVPLLYTT
jgi:hypothetical protein